MNTYPTIHMNGTGAAQLLQQYSAALYALSDAMTALCDAAPHGRDYYPQGDTAYREAAAEHAARALKLGQVYAELERLCLHCQQRVK